MDPAHVALSFHSVFKVDPSSSGGKDDFRSYDFTSGTVQGFQAGRIWSVQRLKIDDGPVVPYSAPIADVNWLLSVSIITISKVKRNYRPYRGINDHYEGTPADVPADIVDKLDDIFAQKVLFDENGGTFVTADCRSGIAEALARLSKVVSILSFKLAKLLKCTLYEIETSYVASGKR